MRTIQYDYLGHPVRIQFTNRNLVEYVYAADGRKLREKHITAVDGLTVQMGNTLELTPAQKWIPWTMLAICVSASSVSARRMYYLISTIILMAAISL